MVAIRVQYFQGFDRNTVAYELHEFLTNLPDTHFKVNDIEELPPSGITIKVVYEATKSDEEMSKEAEKRVAAAEGVIKAIETEAESKKEVTDDDLRKIIQDNLSSNNKEGSIWTIDEKERQKILQDAVSPGDKPDGSKPNTPPELVMQLSEILSKQGENTDMEVEDGEHKQEEGENQNG